MNKILRIFALAAILLFCLNLLGLAQPTPVIWVTDIGAGMDDCWALALLLCSPELDLKLIVTDSQDTVGKAKIVAKFLQTYRRQDIPIGVGIHRESKPGALSAWATDFSLATYTGTIRDDGVQAIVDTISNASQPVTLLITSPCPTVAEALRRAPQITKAARVIAMGGSITTGYDGMPTPDAEYNIRSDIRAAQALFAAPWEITLAPLDTADAILIQGSIYQDLRRFVDQNKTEITIQPIMDAYRSWKEATRSRVDPEIRTTSLADTAPVVLAIQPDFFEIEEYPIRVDTRGYTIQSLTGKPTRVAIRWKAQSSAQNPVDSYSTFLVNRYLKGVLPPPKP
ncbi:MAG: nucleoside hydrolase [bacterium]|jgi:inosine-uridine nucleoside N-ribohydrolase|nr:nucleoside hydrolase [bacterium]